MDETAELPHLLPVLHGHCCCHARRCARTAAVLFRPENCEGPAVSSTLNVVDVPVVQVHLGSSSLGQGR